MSLMEPLPPLDVPTLERTSQQDFLRVLHTFDTPAEHTDYWERTSARQWVVVVQTARKFNIGLNLHMLRMIRATLLYDSIVLRLDTRLSRLDEYRAFMRDRADLIRRRWRSELRAGAGDNVLLRLEEISNSINDAMLRAQATLGRPVVQFGASVDKLAFAISVLSRLAGRVLLVTLLGLALVAANRSLYGTPLTLDSLASALRTVFQSPLYLLFLAAAGALNIRHILFRLRERDDSPQRRRE